MWTLPCLSRYIKWNLEGKCCCGDSSPNHQYISSLRPAQAPARLQQRPKWLKTCLCFIIRNNYSGNWYCNSFQKCRHTHRHTQTQTYTDTHRQILAQTQTQTQTHRYRHRYLRARTHTHTHTHSGWLHWFPGQLYQSAVKAGTIL